MKNIQTIYRTIKQTRYVTVDKHFIDQNNLSLQAKGLLLYLLSKPNNYNHNESDINNHCTNGRDSIRSCVRELIEAGYLLKFHQRNEDGSFNYCIWYILELPSFKSDIPVVVDNLLSQKDTETSLPFTENPSTVKPTTEKPQTDKPLTDIPLTENPTLLINESNKTDLNNLDSNNQYSAVKLRHELKSFFTSFRTPIPDDFDKIDLIELELSLDFFKKNRTSVTNPVPYLAKILESSRRKSPEELKVVEFDNERKIRKAQKLKEIENFNFSGIKEMQYYMKKFDHEAIQFTIYFKDPMNLPEHALKLLKSLAIKDGSFQPEIS